MASVFEPLALASRWAAMVSAVSPDCEIRERHRVRPEDGIAIAPFAGVVDFDRHAGQVLDHELAGQSGMPTGAAGGDIDFLQRFELGFADLHLVEEDGAGIL